MKALQIVFFPSFQKWSWEYQTLMSNRIEAKQTFKYNQQKIKCFLNLSHGIKT